MPEFIDDPQRPTCSPDPFAPMRAVLDRAAAWGAKRRAGEITDPGCESVARLLDRQDSAVPARPSVGRVALFLAIYDAGRAELDPTAAVVRRAE